MDPVITCFEWDIQAGDYLDGCLSDTSQNQMNLHLKACKPCVIRLQHYQFLQKQIKQLQNSLYFTPSLSPTPSKHPLSFRSLMETIGVLIVLFLINGAYLRSQSKRFNFLIPAFPKDDASFKPKLPPSLLLPSFASSAPLLLPAPPTVQVTHPAEAPLIKPVQPVELWRFTIKTVSPDELQKPIASVLKKLNVRVPAAQDLESNLTQSHSGFIVPGGIEFQFILPKKNIPNLINELKNTIKRNQTHTTRSGTEPLLTWYKLEKKFRSPKKSLSPSMLTHLPLDPESAHIMIWLSQTF